MTIVEVLKSARKKIAGGWTKWAFGKTKSGKFVYRDELLNGTGRSDVCSYCVIGSVLASVPPGNFKLAEKVLLKLSKSVDKESNIDNMWAILVNFNMGTKNKVLALFDKLIKNA